MIKTQTAKNQNYIYFFYIVVFAFIIRASIGLGFFTTFDTYWYRNWAIDLPNGLFSVYARAGSIRLDYPPLYLVFLYPIGLIYNSVGIDIGKIQQMALLKFWPIVFDVLTVVFIYILVRKKDETKALICATLWALNPAIIFNCSAWGQTDSVMIFFLFVSFWYLYDKKPVLACCLFAVAGMIKYQSLLFTPVFLLYLWLEYKNKKVFFKGISAAAITVAVVFLPFMIASKKPLLFFEVYFNGAGTYKKCSLNACNIFALFGLNNKSDQNIWGILGIITVIICILVIFVLFLKAKNRCVFAGAFLIMQCIFMFATRMHERYQIAVLIFPLICFAVQNSQKFLGAYFGITLISFVNHVVVLFRHLRPNNPILTNYKTFLVVLSAVNLIAFVYSVYITFDLILNKKEFKPENVKSI